MKTKIIISVLALLMVAGSFGDGCEGEEPKPDYITVNVTTEGVFRFRLIGSPIVTCGSDIYGETVRVDVIKAGGERFNLFTTIQPNGCRFNTSAVSFKLYREQPIEVIAYLEFVDSGYTQVRGQDLLSWDEVYPGTDFGETFNYTANVMIQWIYN